MEISLTTPEEMTDIMMQQGLSIWLYRTVRDEERLNAPPIRISPTQLQGPPLPLRLHYLITPIINPKFNSGVGHETGQAILGKVLQVFNDHPTLQGVDLQDDLQGTSAEIRVRLESLSLDEMSRIYDALGGSYQLSVSYEVSVVYIYSTIEPERISPVKVVMPESGIIVS